MAAYRWWLKVTCRLNACTPGSAPGPTLGNEYRKPLPFWGLGQSWNRFAVVYNVWYCESFVVLGLCCWILGCMELLTRYLIYQNIHHFVIIVIIAWGCIVQNRDKCITVVHGENITSVQSNLAKGRIVDLSPLTAASDLDQYLIHEPIWVSPQTASRSAQRFLHSSSVCPIHSK